MESILLFQEKRADSCHLLAEYMEALEQNFKGAYTLFKQNCEERKYPKSCYKYGMYLLAGKGSALITATKQLFVLHFRWTVHL